MAQASSLSFFADATRPLSSGHLWLSFQANWLDMIDDEIDGHAYQDIGT
jgi:hypothetical protein